MSNLEDRKPHVHNDPEISHRDMDDNDNDSSSSSEDEEGMMMSDMFPVSSQYQLDYSLPKQLTQCSILALPLQTPALLPTSQEPPRPPTPPPTTSHYAFPSTSPFSTNPPLQLQLIGQPDSLWGHILFRSSLIMSDYLITDPRTTTELITGRNVVEFGAGAGVPGLVCSAVGGARKVVLTDYPVGGLVENLKGNVKRNGLEGRCAVEGYIWGRDVSGVVGHLEGESTGTTAITPPATSAVTTTTTTTTAPNTATPTPTPPPIDPHKFQLLLLSDLIFNHSQHLPLIHSLESLIDTLPTSHSRALVFHSHHLPQHRDRDLKFFDLAKKRGWEVKNVVEMKVGVQFVDDGGDVGLREKVWGWEMKWDGVVREVDSEDEREEAE